MNTNHLNPICYFARTNYRTDSRQFGIKFRDRLYHFYILGRTGAGETNLILCKLLQDIQTGGACLIDIHGDLVRKVGQNIPRHRRKDVIYLDVTDPRLDLGYNPLKRVSKEKRALITSHILEVFQRLWGNQAWGVKMAHILRNVLLTLLDQRRTDLSDILRILQDEVFRRQCIPHVTNPDVKRFWEKEFKSYSPKSDLIPIFNKLGGILSYPSVRRILVDNKKQVSLRKAMDKGKILLVNLSKGSIGSEAAYILGSLLLTSLASAAFSRSDTVEHKRKPFFVYLDEFQHYTNLSVVEMLSELRKFKVGLIMAHQYMSQLDVRIRDAVLGNVGTIVTFRLSQADARYMEREFAPIFETSDFVNLANYDIYLKLMIDGRPSVAFSATTLLPHEIRSLKQLP